MSKRCAGSKMNHSFSRYGFRGGQVKKVYKWKEAIHNISVQLKEVIQKRRYHVRLTSVLSGQK